MSATTIDRVRIQRPLLGRLLLADAALCGTMGALLIAFAGPLADLLGLSTMLLLLIGIGLLPWAALVTIIGSRAVAARGAARCVVVGNVLWVVASAILLLSNWVDPTALGVAFVIAQALVVAGIAAVQYLALRSTD